MRWIVVMMLGGLASACGGHAPGDDFEARALGAAYFQFPKSAINLQVSKSSGRLAACGYARKMDGSTPEPGYPFIWVDNEMYAGDRFNAIKQPEVFRLCGANWVAPRFSRPVSSAPAAGTPTAPDRSPAA